jgi:peptidoglycan/xylan/chitin deacetylase (PgdA/CDA1 family)
MGNPLPVGAFDYNALSWGNYGATQGIERLLRVLDRTKVCASIMVSGVLAERHPERVRAIAGAGHEIAAHGYAQEIVPAMLSPEEDRANIERTTELIEQVTGSRPLGWLSPRCTPGAETARHLASAGYEWHGDAFDSDRPYLQQFDTGNIMAIPFAMEINDLPHTFRFGRTPRQFVEVFDDYLENAVNVDDGAIIIDVTAHAHCYGRPGAAWAFEKIASNAVGRDDIWIATRRELSDHARMAVA